jgi:hypothetical protein
VELFERSKALRAMPEWPELAPQAQNRSSGAILGEDATKPMAEWHNVRLEETINPSGGRI